MATWRGEAAPGLTTWSGSPQAVDSRDSMAMALYSQCFNWIICRLNNRIRGRDDFKSISILDIFGFENFEARNPHVLWDW